MRITLSSGTPAALAKADGEAVMGLVIAPDIFGLRPLFDDMVDRIATEQHMTVCAPEPFPDRDLPLDVEARYLAVAELRDELVLRDLVEAAEATGAERVYLPEEGVSLADLQVDTANLVEGFTHGKRLGLVIRNENTEPLYSTEFMCALFENEGGDLFDVRQAILGHVEQGGNPSPFDRIQATRMAARCVDFMIEEAGKGSPATTAIGLQGGEVHFTNMEDFARLVERRARRPKEQWWLDLRPIARIMAKPAPPSES